MDKRDLQKLWGRPAAIIVGVVVALLVFQIPTVAFQVNPQEEGVVLVLGKHTRTVGPGLHWKFPYPFSRVYKVPTQVVDELQFGFRSGEGRTREGRGQFEDEKKMLTGDLNIVLVGWNVQFQRVDPANYLFEVKNPEATLRDISQSVMRTIVGDRASIRILTRGRKQIQARTRQLIQAQVKQFNMGIHVSQVNLRFADPPNQIRDAFDDLNIAEQDAVRFYQEASQKYEERVPRARGEAQRKILEAEGFREERVNVAKGEAARFREMLRAYRQAPEVTRRRLYLETMEKQVPKLEQVVVVDENVRSLLPMLDVGRGRARAAQEGKQP
jgi:membrane protease subunit HflK